MAKKENHVNHKGMNKNKRSQEQSSKSQVYVKKEAKRSGWGSTPFLWRSPTATMSLVMVLETET